MPLYPLKCESCGHRFETFCRIKERDAQTCERCHGPVVGDLERSRVRVERAWDTEKHEGRSLQLCFDPAGIAELRKEIPSIELDPTGAAVYRSDRHQRQVFKEFHKAKERVREELLETAQQAVDQGLVELEDAAEAIRRRFDVE